MGPEQAQLAELVDGLAVVVDGVPLPESVAHAHDHAALDLPLAGAGVHGLAHVVDRHHGLDLPGLPVQNAHLGGVAVGHVGHGVGHVRPQLVGLGEILPVEDFAVQFLQRPHLQGLRQLLAGPSAGFAGDQGLAGAGGVAGVGGDPGVGPLVDDVVPLEGRVGYHHLDQNSAEALPNAGGAGVDMDLLIRLHDQLAAAPVGQPHAHAGVLHGTRKAHRLPGGQSCVIVGLDDLQRLRKPRLRTHDLAVGQLLPGPDGVAVADLPGGDADLLCHLVEERFNGKAGLGHAKAPESPGGGVVGVVGRAFDLEVLVVVGTRGVGAGSLQHGAAQGGEGAGVGVDGGFHALDDAVFVAADGEVHPEGMALGVDQKALRPGELHLHGPAGEIGDEGRVVLDRHILLAAKAAAHQLVLDPDLFAAQQELAFVQRGVGGLVRGEDAHIPVLVPVGHGALGFQERMLRPGGLKVLGDDVLRPGNSPGGVAPAHVLVGLDVVLLLVEDPGGVGQFRLLRAMDGGEGLVGHLHEPFGLFQGLLVLGYHQGDGVPQIVGEPADGDEGVLVVLDVAHLVLPGDILGGDHRHHPGQGFRFLRVNGQHPGPGVLAANGGTVGHVGQIPVVRVFSVAQHLFLHIQPMDAAAQLPVGLGGLGDDAFPLELRRQLDGLDDLHIARAAAVVVSDGIADLLLRGVLHLVKEGLGAQHHPRYAEAALDGTRLPVGIGVELFLPVGEPLHGDHVPALQGVRLRHTGPVGRPVDEHGAGPAGPLGAAVLHGGQVQLVPQKPQQALVLLGRDLFSVHIECSHCSP